MNRCTFERCDLSQVRWDDGIDERNSFLGCDFRGADLRQGLLGVGSAFKDCRFSGTDFRGASFAYPQFESCRFDGCRLEGVDFNASAFVDCVFLGRIQSVFFRGGFWDRSDLKRYGERTNPMRNADFSQAVLDDVAFTHGCDLSTVIPPKDGSHLLLDLWSQRLSRLERESQGWSDADREQAELCVRIFGVDADQEWYLLNKADLVDMHGDAAGVRIATNLEQELPTKQAGTP